MEVTKNIFFNTDKLIENTKVKISYTGKLFQEKSERVFIHYGFGLLWEELSELEMEKTDLGFQAEIELKSYANLNFCFKNESSVWDNNTNKNFSFDIEKMETAIIKRDEIIALTEPRRLKKSYILSKKIRLAIYKVVTYIPKLISGKYKRKLIN